MKKIKKILIAVLLISVLGGSAFALAACNRGENSGGESGGTITLNVWADSSNIEALKQVATNFSAEYKKAYPFAASVKIDFVEQAEASAVEKLQTNGPAGTGPDIFAFVQDTLGTAVEAGLIAPNSYADAMRQNISEDSVSAFSYNGTVYGFPSNKEAVTLMYDKSKLSAGDVESFSTLLASGKKIAWSIADSDYAAYYAYGLFTDADLFGEKGTDKTSVNLAGAETVNNLYNLVTKYQSSIMRVDNVSDAIGLMQAGTVAGVITSPYLWSAMKSTFGANAAVATLPGLDGVYQSAFAGYKGYGVSSYSKNPALAQMFAAYLINAQNQFYMYKTLGYIPTLNDMALEAYSYQNKTFAEALAADSVASTFIDAFESSRAMPTIVAMGYFWSPANSAVTSIWNLGSKATKAQITSYLTNATAEIKSSIGA